jgi:hypothetical protein
MLGEVTTLTALLEQSTLRQLAPHHDIPMRQARRDVYECLR